MTFTGKVIAAGALMIVVCIGALSFWSEVRNELDREWVTHTLLVVEKLQEVRIDITQAETGQRGYMLTGQDRYLELYGAGVDRVHRDMSELPDLVLDNPKEHEASQRLDPLIAARLAELETGIEVRKRSGLLAGVEAASGRNNGEKLMGQVAVEIGEMRAAEAELLSKRLETAAASARKMKAIVVGGNGLAIIILLAKGFVIHRETCKRNLAEQNLKHTNERLERRTSELSETNVELESFAYSVAHDLRGPLRHIAGYSNVLAQDYAPQLNMEGRRYLAKVSDGAQKMGHLIDDLLSLSKVGLQELSLQTTSLDALVRQVMNEFEMDSARRTIEWQISKLFDVKCDPALMKQVFVNLLSNAVKYSGKREHPIIQVGQMEKNHERLVFVRDNGVGFEMQYVGKLFGTFQRLHKTGDFEGTGVGLAIVQRIIRKHGGLIWAEAEPDRGATFFFTLGSAEIKPSAEAEPDIKEEARHV